MQKLINVYFHQEEACNEYMMRKRIRGNEWSIQSKMTNNFLITWPPFGERTFHQARRVPVETKRSTRPFMSSCWWSWSGHIWATLSSKPRSEHSLVMADFYLCVYFSSVISVSVRKGKESFQGLIHITYPSSHLHFAFFFFNKGRFQK